MADISVKPVLDVKVHFVIDESEARALDALAGYGTDTFVEAFYEKLGKAYMAKHEAGLRKFLDSIREATTPALITIDKARNVIDELRKSRVH